MNDILILIQQATGLKRGLFELSNYMDKSTLEIDISDHPVLKSLLRLQDLDLYLPTEANMIPALPEIVSDKSPFPDDSPTIKSK